MRLIIIIEVAFYLSLVGDVETIYGFEVVEALWFGDTATTANTDTGADLRWWLFELAVGPAPIGEGER